MIFFIAPGSFVPNFFSISAMTVPRNDFGIFWISPLNTFPTRSNCSDGAGFPTRSKANTPWKALNIGANINCAISATGNSATTFSHEPPWANTRIAFANLSVIRPVIATPFNNVST